MPRRHRAAPATRPLRPLQPAEPKLAEEQEEAPEEVAVETRTPTLDALANEPPPEDPEADARLAADIFSDLDDAVGIGLLNRKDGDSAAQLLAGRTPSEMAAIRAEYENRTGRTLEDDLRGQFDDAQGNELMANVLQGMSLRDKLEHYETSESMENLVQHASEAEIRDLVSNEDGTVDRSVLETMRDKMDEHAFMEMRMRLFPQDRVAAVTERIEQADNYFDDDEGAAMDAFANLTPAERQTVLDSSPDLLHYMNPTERARMRAMARDEASGLQARMRQATVGAGTDDDSVPEIVEDARDTRQRQQMLQTQLERADLPDGERAHLQSQLDSMGNLDSVFSVDRNEDGSLREGSFLGRLRGDVKAGEFQAHMRSMGFSEAEVSKQVVLDAMDRINDDERGVREAFGAIPADQRQALWDDPHVQAALTGLTAEELAEVESFRDDDRAAMARTRMDDANGLFGQDEAKAIEAIIGLDESSRAEVMESAEFAETRRRMDPLERLALDEVAETGDLSVDVGMRAAAGYDLDGTNEELMQLASSRRTDDDAVQLRQGFLLDREGTEPQSPEDIAALARFRSIESTFDAELDDDDKQLQMDALLEHTRGSSGIENATADGRMGASTLNNLRAVEKMGPDGDGGGRIADWFIDQDETALQSHQAQMSQHFAAMSDGEIEIAELEMHDALMETFGEDYQSMLDAQNEVTDTAAAVAAATAMIAATLATGGTFGPAAMAFMAQYGTLVTTVGATAATIGTKELVGGDRYNTFGADGATDVGMAAVDALSSQATGKLGDLALGQLSEVIPGVAQPLARMNADTLRHSTLNAIRTQAPGVLLSTAVDTGIGTVSGALQENLVSEEFWNMQGGDMLQSLGDSTMAGLEQLPASMAQDFVQNLALTGFEAHAVGRMTDDLELSGVDTEGLSAARVQELTIEQYESQTPALRGPGANVADEEISLGTEEISTEDLEWDSVLDDTAFVQGEGDSHAISGNDVMQGDLANCNSMASLLALAETKPEIIQNMLHQQEDGSYVVLLTVPGENGLETRSITVDPTIAYKVGAASPAFAQVGDQVDGANETWPMMSEKALAAHAGGFENTEFALPENPIYNTLEMFSGLEQQKFTGEDFSALGDVSGLVQQQLEAGSAITMGSNWTESGTSGRAEMDALNLAPGHMFAVTGVDADTGEFLLSNPWGVDHVRLPPEALSQHFSDLNFIEVPDNYLGVAQPSPVQDALDPHRNRDAKTPNEAHTARPEVMEGDALWAAQERANVHIEQSDNAAYVGYLTSDEVFNDVNKLTEMIDTHTPLASEAEATMLRMRQEYEVPGVALDNLGNEGLSMVASLEAAAEAGDWDEFADIGFELRDRGVKDVDLIEAPLVSSHDPEYAADDRLTQALLGAGELMQEDYTANNETLDQSMAAFAQNEEAVFMLSETLSEAQPDLEPAEQARVWASQMRDRIPEDHPGHALHDTELLSTLLYTGDLYTPMNDALRDRTPEQIEAMLPFLQGATSAINKLPDAEVNTRRRTDHTDVFTDNLWVPGGFANDAAFLSTSQDPLLTSFGEALIMDVESSSGADVNMLSKFGPIFGDGGNESEVLLPPGTRFEVLDEMLSGASRYLNLRERRD